MAESVQDIARAVGEHANALTLLAADIGAEVQRLSHDGVDTGRLTDFAAVLLTLADGAARISQRGDTPDSD